MVVVATLGEQLADHDHRPSGASGSGEQGRELRCRDGREGVDQDDNIDRVGSLDSPGSLGCSTSIGTGCPGTHLTPVPSTLADLLEESLRVGSVVAVEVQDDSLQGRVVAQQFIGVHRGSGTLGGTGHGDARHLTDHLGELFQTGRQGGRDPLGAGGFTVGQVLDDPRVGRPQRRPVLPGGTDGHRTAGAQPLLQVQPGQHLDRRWPGHPGNQAVRVGQFPAEHGQPNPGDTGAVSRPVARPVAENQLDQVHGLQVAQETDQQLRGDRHCLRHGGDRGGTGCVSVGCVVHRLEDAEVRRGHQRQARGDLRHLVQCHQRRHARGRWRTSANTSTSAVRPCRGLSTLHPSISGTSRNGRLAPVPGDLHMLARHPGVLDPPAHLLQPAGLPGRPHERGALGVLLPRQIHREDLLGEVPALGAHDPAQVQGRRTGDLRQIVLNIGAVGDLDNRGDRVTFRDLLQTAPHRRQSGLVADQYQPVGVHRQRSAVLRPGGVHLVARGRGGRPVLGQAGAVPGEVDGQFAELAGLRVPGAHRVGPEEVVDLRVPVEASVPQ